MKYTRKQIITKRNSIVKQKNYIIVKIFDTLEKTSGEKDVSLCKTPTGNLVILRIGEIHPKNFFPNGYIGKNLVIPKLYESHNKDLAYEIEEYLGDTMVSDIDMKNHLLGKVDDKILKKLIVAFWEFQSVASNIKLKKHGGNKIFIEHLKIATPLLKSPETVKKIFTKNKKFWNELYPSKWKFATDNLLVIPNDKIGFIDNANVGLRYFAYDLGWIIWPRWVEMKTSQFDKIDEHLVYLEKLMKLAKKMKPKHIKIDNFERKFWLMIFQRLVGAIFDVARNVRHLADWNMGPTGNKKRTEKHLYFLNSLLEEVIKKV